MRAKSPGAPPGWKSSYNISPDLVSIIGSDHKFIKVNRSLARRLGQGPAELVGTHCYQAIHGVDVPPAFCPIDKALKEGKPITQQVYAERLGGHFLVTTTPVETGDGPASAVVHIAHEVTTRVEAETTLRLTQEQLSLVTQATRLGLWEWRANPGLIYVTDLWREITGFDAPREGFDFGLWLGRVHPDDAEELHKHFRAMVDGQSDYLQEEFEVLHPKKGIIWLRRTATVAERDAQGRALRVIGFHQDVTESKNLAEELERLAMTDALTGMCNQRYFLERAGYEFLRSNRYQRPFSVCLLDIDRLQEINERHGQFAGDGVIRTLARTCQTVLRKTDILGRMSGKRFAVLFLETKYPKVLEACERLRLALSRATSTSAEGPVNFTVSIGVSSVTSADGNIEDIIERADLALQDARSRGGNCVIFFQEDQVPKKET